MRKRYVVQLSAQERQRCLDLIGAGTAHTRTVMHARALLRADGGPHREYARKLDGRQEAYLLALAHSAPPEGHRRWSLRLLADQMVELQYVDSLSHMTVSRTLKEGR